MLLFFAATVASRYPFRNRTLYTLDSGSFALALERFDLVQQRPHAPGYILYVGAGRLLGLLTPNPNNALVGLSIFCAAISVAGIYLVGKSIFGRTVGIVAAVMLFFSPLFWFYSEVALSYMVEVPLTLLIIWLLYQLFFYRRFAVICGAVLGLAAGFRLDPLIFLGPLFFIASFRVGWRMMLLSWLAVAGGVAVWLIPLVISAGGWSNFSRSYSGQYNSAILPYSFFSDGLDAMLINAKEIFKSVLWLLGPAIVLVFAVFRTIKVDRRTLFWLLAMLPAFLSFLLFFIDPPGYLLVCAVPIILLLAQVAVGLAGWLERLIGRVVKGDHARRLFNKPVILTVLLSLNSFVCLLFFMFGSITLDRVLPGSEGSAFLFTTYNANGLKSKSDAMYTAIDKVRQYDPADTVVVCNIENNIFDWRRLMFYLPEYRVIGVDLDGGSDPAEFIEGLNHFVWIGDSIIEVSPNTKRLVFIGQGDLESNFFRRSNNHEDVFIDMLVVPDRYPPSFFAVVEPLKDGFQLGGYSFRQSG